MSAPAKKSKQFAIGDQVRFTKSALKKLKGSRGRPISGKVVGIEPASKAGEFSIFIKENGNGFPFRASSKFLEKGSKNKAYLELVARIRLESLKKSAS